MTGWTDAQQSHVREKKVLMHSSGWANVDMLHLCGHLLCWERSDLLALLYVMFLSHSQITHLTQDTLWETFPYGVLGQVWYLIVWILDLCLLHYFYLMYMYAKFNQNIPCGSRVTQWAVSLKEHDRPKWCSATHCLLFAYFSLIDHGRTDSHSDYSTDPRVV